MGEGPLFSGRDVSDQEARTRYWETVSPEKMETVLFRKRARRACLEWIIRRVGDAQTILDAGCGYSPFYDKLRASGYAGQFIGFDPVEPMIDYNIERTKQDPHAKWYVATWQEFLCVGCSRERGACDNEKDTRYDVVAWVNVHGSFPKDEALDSISCSFNVAEKRVLVTNLDEELYRDRREKSTHKFTAFTPSDYESILRQGWRLETEVIAKRHRGAMFERL